MSNAITNQMGPFSVVPLWVLADLVELGQPEALRLYVALSKWTDGVAGSCYPSRQTIAQTIGCSKRTIDGYVKALTDIGALQVERRFDAATRRHISSIYTVFVVRGVAKHTALPSEADCTGGSAAHCAQTNTHYEPIPNDPYSLLTPSETSTETFDEFWDLYPRKVSKKRARTAWKNLTAAQRSAALEAISSHVEYWNNAGRGSETIPHPTTWLHGESWEDELTPVTASSNLKETKSGLGLDAIERSRLKLEQRQSQTLPLPKELTT